MKHSGVISKQTASLKGESLAASGFVPVIAPAKAASDKSASAADVPGLMGCVSYADSWNETGVGLVGIYEIGADALVPVSLHENMLTSYGQVYAGTKYLATEATLYGSWVYDMHYNIFDTRDWSDERVEGNYNFNARAMAFDPVSRRAYAITRDDEYYYYLSVMDMDTYKYKEINRVGIDDWSALMCSGDGKLYGIKKDGELVSFDKVTGACTSIGQTGLASTKMTSGTIDAASGRCFYVCYTVDSSELYEVDLKTAEVKFLYDVPERAQILSLFVPEAIAPDSAPAVATQLEATFAGTEMSGTFSFTLPSATIGGEAITGVLSYTVLVDGVQHAAGEGQPGETVSCPVSFTASGEYTFSVIVGNGENEGEIASITSWIGYELPAVPKNVTLGTENDKLTLSWTPVTVPSGSEITYTVVGYPSGDVLAQNLTEPTYTCDIPVTEELALWSFGVTAVNGDSHSPEALSSNFISGYLSLPYYEDFESASSIDYFTIIDANDDKRTWAYQFFGEGRLMINYSYSQPHNDWAVLHPVKFEKGKIYTIGCDLKGTGYYTEKIEIVVAKGKDLESLAEGVVILPVTEIKSENYNTYEAKFLPEEDGVYYVALHAVSASYQNILYVDNLFISKGTSTLAPGAVGGLAITPDISGALSANIAFTAPVYAMSGDPISELSYVVIERGDQEIGRINTEDPGEPLSFTDTTPVNGTNTYTVVAYNSYGRGVETTVSVYIGLSEPATPENVSVQYGKNTGEAFVSWTAPTLDISGHALGNAELTYNVKRVINGSSPKTVATGITATEYSEQAVDADADQVFVNYIIEAVAVGGTSDGCLSNIYPLGRPETTPAKESFGGRVTDYEWGAEADPNTFTYWDIFPAGELPFDTYDGGSAVAAYNPYLSDDNTASLISSLFDLSTLEKPVLTFYLLDYKDTSNRLVVSVNNGKEWVEVQDVEFGKDDLAWTRRTVDLSAFKDQVVCIRFFADVADYNIIALDNLRITNDADHNLATLNFSVPESSEANSEFNVVVSYENAGKEKAENYTVDLLCNNEVIASHEGAVIEPEATATVSFSITLPVTSPEKLVYQAVINYNLDEIAADNATDEIALRFETPVLPAPLNLSAVPSGKEVLLTWDEPDLGSMALTPSVDDIESYTPFSTGLPNSPVADDNVGDWTMYDVDGLTTYTGTFDYVGVGEPIAFVVYNSYMQEDNVFACHSGHQMFLSLASRPVNNQFNDDWLVSPELAGCAQTISFYAKSIDTYGEDLFQVLYSTGGKEISDFVLLSEQESTGDWKQYSYSLPAGTTYFAVRCISEDKYAFLLDDFKMITTKDGVSDIETIGYNIYCNGKKVNNELVTDRTFTHTPAADQTVLRYNVSCVFNAGESMPSETVEVKTTPTGVEDINAASEIEVKAGEGVIVVKGLSGENVTVVDTAGRTIYSANGNGDVKIGVSAGIYIVKAGSVTVKAIVK